MSARPPQDKKATSTPLASIAPQIARPAPKPGPESASEPDALPDSTNTPEIAAPDTDVVPVMPVVPLSDAGTSDTEANAAVTNAAAGDAAREEARRRAAMPYDAAADAAARAAKAREQPKGRGIRRMLPTAGSRPARTARGAEPVVVPRTIADLQRQEAGASLHDAGPDTAAPVTEAMRDAVAVDEEPAVPLRVPFRSVILATVAMWLLAAVAPELGFAVGRLLNASTLAIFATYAIVLAVGSALMVIVLDRSWRAAFGLPPHELNWRTLPDLWRRRFRQETYASGLPRRDTWITVSVAAVFGFLLLLTLLVYTAVTVAEFRQTFLFRNLPALVSRGLCGAIFLGFLYKALIARYPRSRAAILAGVALGFAVAVPNILRFAILLAPVDGQSVLSPSDAFLASAVALPLDLLIGVSVAWLRLRSRSVWAAVAFLLTLVILGLPV